MKKLQTVVLSALLTANAAAADAQAGSANAAVTEVRLVGAEPDDADEILASLATRPGIEISDVAIAADIKRLWRSGLFEDVVVDLERGGRVVTFRVTPHPLASSLRGREGSTVIERIEITGNSKTRESVIRRELLISAGTALTRDDLALSAKRVRALGFFKLVEVTVRPGSGPRLAVVAFAVTERPTGTFQFGGSYGTVSGLGATAGIAQANLFGSGQELALKLRYARREELYQLRYRNPRIGDTWWAGTAGVHNARLDLGGIRRHAVGTTVSIARPLARRSLVVLTYRLEQVSSAPLLDQWAAKASGTPVFADDLFRSGLTSSVRADLIHDSRGRAFSGSSIGAYAELASPLLASENHFQRIGASAALPLAITERIGVVLSGTVDWIGSSNPRGVPVSERLRMWGHHAVRGYGPGDLGPQLTVLGSDGLTTISYGGNLRLVANAELQFPLLPAIGLSGVAFVDVGNTFNLERRTCRATGGCPTLAEMLSGLRASTGLGIRVASPLGPLRVDWGVPLARRAGDPRFRLHVGFGGVR